MDGTLTLIFAKSETTWDIITKISASLQLRKKWILTKFGGCSSKNGLARSIRSFRHFWWEIQIWRHLEPSYLVQSGYLLRLTTGENLVLISQTTFEKLKFEHFSLSIPSLVGIKIVFENYFYTTVRALWGRKIFNFEFLKSDLRYQHQIFTTYYPQ